ncbi:MAG: hypothetical protein GXO20_01030 [Thermodesulfobacteria bacterium]|nr:hypothetical protein [Thermodesulfobacteriota bacterium]
MNFSFFIERVIFRDLFSYIIPGGILEIYIALSYYDDLVLILDKIKNIIGYKMYILLGLMLAYILGYFVSTVGFFLKDILAKLMPYCQREKEDIMEYINVLKNQQIPYMNYEPSKDKGYKELTQSCLYIMQEKFPDFYHEKIEKRITLRNFELGMIITFVFILLFEFAYRPKLHQLILSFIVIMTMVFMFGCRRLDKEINCTLPIKGLANLLRKEKT